MLDTLALLALLNQELESEASAPILPNTAISTVNFAEVISKLIGAGIPAELVNEILDNLAFSLGGHPL